MIFLSSPYSSPDAVIRTTRLKRTREFVWSHLQHGVQLFSPIVYGHVFYLHHEAPTDASFWSRLDMDMLAVAEMMWVLRLPGWEQSIGVQMELEYCTAHNKAVEYKDLADAGL